jgi:hypothetical protein
MAARLRWRYCTKPRLGGRGAAKRQSLRREPKGASEAAGRSASGLAGRNVAMARGQPMRRWMAMARAGWVLCCCNCCCCWRGSQAASGHGSRLRQCSETRSTRSRNPRPAQRSTTSLDETTQTSITASSQRGAVQCRAGLAGPAVWTVERSISPGGGPPGRASGWASVPRARRLALHSAR